MPRSNLHLKMTSNIPDETWLRALPKAELHLHLEGTVTPSTLISLSKKHNPTNPLTPSCVEKFYTYTSFTHFLDTFSLVCDLLRTPADYAFITYEMMRALGEQGVLYAEVYIAFGNLLFLRPELDLRDVMRAIENARERATRDFKVDVAWIADATRGRGVEEAGRVFRAAATLRTEFPSLIGIGIGGNEHAGPTALFAELYAEAKEAGLRLTAHAGESTGPDAGPKEIRAALSMEVERIGHGVAAQWDEAVLKELVSRQVPVEVNVTSNVRTGVVSRYASHPLPTFLEARVLVVLGSDDPPMFGSDLLGEYGVVVREYGYGKEECMRLARNSFEASFLDEAKKREYLALLKQYE